MYTYDPKKISISLGNHIATGIAEDSFVTIDPNGDGITKKVGCDGEVVRSISPDNTYAVKITVFQQSPTNAYLEKQLAQDKSNGKGYFAIMVKDTSGNFVFSANEAWVIKPASRGFGKEAGTREWEIHTGSGTLKEN